MNEKVPCTRLYTQLDLTIGDEVEVSPGLIGTITGIGETTVMRPGLGLVPLVLIDIRIKRGNGSIYRLQHRIEYPELATPLPVPFRSPRQRIGHATQSYWRRQVAQSSRREHYGRKLYAR